MRLSLVIILIASLFTSCAKQASKTEEGVNSTSSRQVKKKPRFRSALIYSSISDCRNECTGDSGKVWSSRLDGDTLSLRLGHWLNCAWQQGRISNALIRHDTIDLIITRPHEGVEVDEHGNKTKIYAMTDCNCYFFLDLKVRRIDSLPKVFLINRRPLENYWGEAPD